MDTSSAVRVLVGCAIVTTLSISGLAVGLGSGAISLRVDGVAGANGIDGTNGQVGAPGVDGVNGVDGAPGANGVDGANGSPGAQGAAGRAGTPGADGANGADGVNGIDGTNGVDGANGIDGTNGVDGANGTDGLNGANGVDGVNGSDGAQGPTGVVSASAPLMYDMTGQSLSLDLDNFSHLAGLGFLQFDTTSNAENAPGRLTWNNDDGTLDLQLKDGLVTLQVGQENVQLVRNANGSTLLDGRAVRVNGSAQGRITVEYGDYTTPLLSTSVIGILTEDIASGGEGYVTTYGLVRNLDTAAWPAGSTLYMAASGQLTATFPSNGHVVELGYVVVSDAVTGSIFVNPRQSLDPIIGSPCVVPGQVGSGVYGWHNLAGARWIIVCDY